MTGRAAGWAGILQADAYAGFGELYEARRSPRPITEAACWARGRRKFFVLADLRQMPLAIEAVRRIDEIFAIERAINGAAPEQRHAVRQDQATGHRAARLDADRARPAVAPCRYRQGDGLYVEALACFHAVSR